MYANRKSAACACIIAAALLCATATAQTLDEIAQLQRTKVAAELLKKSTDAVTAISPIQQPGPPGSAIAGAGLSMPDPAPVVVAIYGLATNLSALIMHRGDRPVRVKEGDQTPSGLMVQRITTSGVHFVRTSTKKNESTKTIYAPWMPSSTQTFTHNPATPMGLPTALPVAMPPIPTFAVPAPGSAPEAR